MAGIIDMVNKGGKLIQPLFITCDPERDDTAALKTYLSGMYFWNGTDEVEFHPDIVGLTGSWEDIKQTCKYFRVYFSTPPNVKPGQDYLVDHSIFFYLMGMSLECMSNR
jgi:protein SCO1/2